MQISKDINNKVLHISQTYNTSIENLWDAFTKSEILREWWAPKPYRLVTKTLNFIDNGEWIYYMLSPEGEKHWCKTNYFNIEHHKSFELVDFFCDEDGNLNAELPSTKWKNDFKANHSSSTISHTITFKTEEDFKKILEMGFEQGYELCLKQLEEYISR